jgi:hypothetical protein
MLSPQKNLLKFDLRCPEVPGFYFNILLAASTTQTLSLFKQISSKLYIYGQSNPASHKTQHITAAKAGRVMMFRGITPVCFGNIQIHCVTQRSFFNITGMVDLLIG